MSRNDYDIEQRNYIYTFFCEKGKLLTAAALGLAMTAGVAAAPLADNFDFLQPGVAYAGGITGGSGSTDPIVFDPYEFYSNGWGQVSDYNIQITSNQDRVTIDSGAGWEIYVTTNNHGTWQIHAEGVLPAGHFEIKVYAMFGNPERVYVTTVKISGVGSADFVEFFGTGSHSINQVRVNAVFNPGPGPVDPKDPDPKDPDPKDPDPKDTDPKENPGPGGGGPTTNPGTGTITNYDPGSDPGDGGGNIPDGPLAIGEPEIPLSPPRIPDKPIIVEEDVPLSVVPKTNISNTLPLWGFGGIVSLLTAIRSLYYLRKGKKTKKEKI